MTEALRPYPEYRDSGLPWLGHVPAHWEVRRNGRLFAQRNETGFGELPILEVSLKTGVRVRDMENMNRKQVMSDREKYKRAVKGDIAYNMMRMWQGAVGAAPVDGLVSPAYVVARPYAGTETRYFSYLFRTGAYMAEIDGYSRGIVKDRNRLYWEDFKRMPSCYPALAEQVAIADYLDTNAALVRKFIRNRRRLIEVLHEQKQAIVNHSVTRAFDPPVTSGLSHNDWLDQVPHHWQVVSLRHLSTKFGSGVTPRGGATVYRDTGVPFLRSQNVHFDGLHLVGVARITPGLHAALCATHVQPNDVLLNITGASIGRVCVVPPDFAEGNVNQHVCIIRPKSDKLRSEFLAAYLSTGFMQREIYLEQNGASREGLALNAIRAFKIALPPLDEQCQIMDDIHRRTAKLTLAASTAESEIDLIREYRERLIAAVVMGKLDVRHLASLPRGPEDEEPAAIDADDVLANHDLSEDDSELVAELADAEE